MSLNNLVIEILNKYKEDKKNWGDILALEEIEKIWINKFSLSKKEVIQYSKIGQLQYTHIELWNGDN